MTLRALLFVAVLLAGLGLGLWQGGAWGAVAGLALAALAAFAIDAVRASRVLRWLRRQELAGDEAPRLWGVWGETVDRIRRALRLRDQQLAQANSRLQETLAAIQASPNGVTLLDAQGRIEWCNQTAAEHFGFDPQKDLLQLVGNLVRDPAFAAYLQVGDYSRDVVIPARGSTPARPRKVAVQLHPYGEGRMLLLSRDVTAVELAETMRRDFVANVSHEIRTPLTVLSGFIETMQNLPLEADDRARYLGLMGQQAQRMQALVSDLLTLSRLEGSPLPGMQEWVPLLALSTQCEKEGRGLSEALSRRQQLDFEAPPGLEVSCASTELHSAMSNLVGNAIRYTPVGGRVWTTWRVLDDGAAEFSVHDTGAGIAPEHIPRLTERFYRVDRSRSRETGGTGLGLAIVKHVIQRHGGILRIESQEGQGSVFTLRLPASRLRALSAPGGLPSGASAPLATAGR